MLRIFSESGWNNPGSTWFFTNGAPSVRAVPPRQAADIIGVKSPLSISAVGTNWSAARGASTLSGTETTFVDLSAKSIPVKKNWKEANSNPKRCQEI
jgi:hypothetical protein